MEQAATGSGTADDTTVWASFRRLPNEDGLALTLDIGKFDFDKQGCANPTSNADPLTNIPGVTVT